MQSSPEPEQHDAFAAVYRAHHDFVWRTLRHLGVDATRLDDALQDTFIVVYRRLGEFEGRSTLRTWLFQIARRVAGRYRKLAEREAPRRCELHDVELASGLDEDVARAEAAEILRVFLEQLDPDKSVVFMMAELEQRRVPEIADALAINLNTVYARLRSARQQLDRLIQRIQAREERPRIRRAAEVVAAALLVQLPATARAWSPTAIDLALPEIAEDVAPACAPASAAAPLAASAVKVKMWGLVAGLAVCGAITLAAAGPPAPPAAATVITSEASTPSSERGYLAYAPIAARPGPGQHAYAPSAARPEPAAPNPAPAPARSRRSTAGDRLEKELALIAPARAALLAGEPQRALRLLARHRRQFPGSMFAQEVAATRIEALCRHGDDDAARRERAEFTRRWPTSNLSTWVDSLCAQ